MSNKIIGGYLKRMKIALVLAVVTVAANIFFIRYAKRKYHRAKADETSNLNNGSYAYSKGYLNTPEVKRLKQSAATELSISVEELDRMSAEEVSQLAKEQ